MEREAAATPTITHKVWRGTKWKEDCGKAGESGGNSGETRGKWEADGAGQEH